MKDEEKDKPLYEGDASQAPYPLTVSSPEIKPEDKRLIKANAYEAMQQHANQQITMLRKQAELILQQVREIEERVELSKLIYKAEMRFTPIVGEVYYLYRKNNRSLLAMIGPEEWGKRGMPYDEYIATVKLLADKTWDIISKNKDAEI